MSQAALAFNAIESQSTFKFGNRAVRILMRNGEPWFACTDVAEALGYRNAPDASRHLDADEKGTHILRTLGGDQKLTIINESGLYALVLRSRKPEARKFAKWVTSEVLPSIRKTGAYGTPRIDPEELLLSDLLALTLPLPPNVQRALDFRAWQLAGEAHGLIHEHLRRRVASDAVIGYPEKYIDEGNALSAISSGDLGDALAYCWTQKMSSLIVYAEVQAAAAAECVAKMRAAIEP